MTGPLQNEPWNYIQFWFKKYWEFSKNNNQETAPSPAGINEAFKQFTHKCKIFCFYLRIIQPLTYRVTKVIRIPTNEAHVPLSLG